MDISSELDGGTGKRLGNVVIILTGVAGLVATVLTAISVWLQAKNYRKPLLQRYVIRILLLVPIFSAASWASVVSNRAAPWISPFHDVYEAFTIYAFFQLLINFLGGERALIIMMVGRPPVSHLWPLSRFLPKVDISDPYTFLAIKRGILQYTWIKPMLAIANVIMKATGTYKEGVIGLNSGYLWSGIVYNVSISISLYALALFWICMSSDLTPFRPMPKFLCIKGIIFASYWQGFGLSILVKLQAIPDDVPGYTRDNLATAIQDTLICFEMPIFAVLHWYAFSWKDYADVTISSARMPVKYALRDACGCVDLIQDAKETFAGSKYEYRQFDAGDDVLAHEESQQRIARMMEGMRYERGGKGKYWIPKPGTADNKTPLLGDKARSDHRGASSSRSSARSISGYGAMPDDADKEPELTQDEEDLYVKARKLEFGDWNYPVITAHHASREDRLYRAPAIVTASTNRHVLQPTQGNRARRKLSVEKIQQSMDKGKHRESSSSGSSGPNKSRVPRLSSFVRPTTSSDDSPTEDRSQLIDLVVEDENAEEIERVRARKEGSPEWNKHEAKHFVRTEPESEQVEHVRQGFEPTVEYNQNADQQHTLTTTSFAINEEDEEGGSPSSTHDEPSESQQWERREYLEEEENVWDSPRQ